MGGKGRGGEGREGREGEREEREGKGGEGGEREKSTPHQQILDPPLEKMCTRFLTLYVHAPESLQLQQTIYL
jgi:hypothetical protein